MKANEIDYLIKPNCGNQVTICRTHSVKKSFLEKLNLKELGGLAFIAGISYGKSTYMNEMIKYYIKRASEEEERIMREKAFAEASKILGAPAEKISVLVGARYQGYCMDVLSIDDLVSFQEQMSIDDKFLYKDSIEEHHKGKGDPCGLRQQFNRNGKKFR